MAQYGEMLGDVQVSYNTVSSQPETLYSSEVQRYGVELNNYEIDRKFMYKIFDDYFNHPIMIKIKDVNGYSMYMIKTYCMIGIGCRYIIAFVKKDNMPINSKESLSTLKWESLQTRTLTDQHNIASHRYQPSLHSPLNVPIVRNNVNKNTSTYSCNDFPLTVTLLHTKKSINEYSERGNIVVALETFNTIVTLT